MMKTGKLLCAIILFFCMAATSGHAKKAEDPGYILVLNSVNYSEAWTKNLYQVVADEFGDEIRVDTEELSVPTIYSREEADRKIEALLEKYPERPKLVVCIGDPSWLLCRPLFDNQWKDVPTLICYSRERIPQSIDLLFSGEKIPSDKFISTKELTRGYNLTIFRQPFFVNETIELIKKLLPGLKKIAFICDNRYISRAALTEVQKVMQEMHPDLGLDVLNSKNLSIENLLDSLNHYDNTVGVIYYSWFVNKHNGGQHSFLDDRLQTMIYGFSQGPVFTLSDVETKSGSFAGGYFISLDEFAGKVIFTIRDILSGRPARDIPIRDGGHPEIYLNYHHLQHHKVDSKLYPLNAVYYQKPPTFWQKYKVQVISASCIVLLLIMLLAMRLHMYFHKQKQRKNELVMSTRYKQLVSNMPIIYIRKKLMRSKKNKAFDYTFMDVNPAFENLFGVHREEIIGHTLLEMIEAYPDLGCLKHNIDESVSVIHTDTAGREHYYDKLVFGDSAEEDIIDVFFIDKTEAHAAMLQTEEFNNRYKLVQQASNMSIWTWDFRSNVIECNIEHSNDQLQFRNRDKHISLTREEYFALIHEDDRERVRQAVNDLRAGKTTNLKEEFRLVYPEFPELGTVWNESFAVIGTRDDKGRPLSLVGASMNITERKKLEDELIKAKDKAEESNRLKSAFLANMSHEIRTPLNAIVGFSSILAATDDEAEKKEYVSIIENNNQMLLQLIGDILDLAKIEAGTLEFTMVPVHINSMLTEIEQSSMLRLQNDNIQIVRDEHTPDMYVQTDKHRVTQVITNFITNAMKFTSQGTIRLGCRLENNGGRIRFYVEDTGCGIPKEMHDEIFKRFVKVDTFKQGTGLGLSICESIVSKLGGDIGVESEPGKGSTFWFTIPFVAAELEDHGEEAEESRPIRIDKEKPTMLIAEDDPSNYKLFESILGKEYNLLHAENGRQAVEMFREHTPHLILMDIKMPELDGYQATAEIRKISKSVPIIAVTAYAFEGDESKIMGSGFNGYIPKPIQAQTLKAKIVDLLKNRLVFLY